ncbi:MAG: hypothetical protein HKO53_19165 [Gemmatimonadetes bacterium]|nr:hypothetical protein [Gemmatimonadota bacterium]
MKVIGVDGGGTRSRGVLMAGSQLVAEADGGAAIILPDTPEAAAAAVEALARDLAEQGGADLPVDALWAGLAGAGRTGPRTEVVARLEAAGLARAVQVGTDVEAAHADAFGGAPGMLLVLGTGSVLHAQDPTGSTVRVGGWGVDLGDEGSGYRIGLDGLRAVVRGWDGRERVTDLTSVVLEALKLDDPSDLLDWSGSAAKADMAAVSPLVIRAAQDGDEVASRVVSQALSDIRTMLEAARRRTRGWTGRPGLALVGGLTRPERLGGLVKVLAEDVGYSVVDRPVVPERGAAALAGRLVAEETA